MSKIVPKSKTVFLGGTCGHSTWRKDIAVPEFAKAKIKFFNPQVEEWSPSLVLIEEEAKESSYILLFVIGKETPATASIAEAAYYIGRQRSTVLVLMDHEDNEDSNRARAYLRGMAEKHHVPIFVNVHTAVHHVIDFINL
jgi:hypothetical protein